MAARATLARRAAGAVLLLLLLLPWYRLVGGDAVGPAAEQTLRLGGSYLAALWLGCALTLAAVFGLGWIVPARLGTRLWDAIAGALLRPRPVRFALGAGAVAALVAAWVSLAVLERRPILLDGVSQLVQARYFGSGMLAGPVLEDPAFWQFQFMVMTGSGWASQYPPGYAAALALLDRVLPLWLVGPLLLGAAVALLSRVGERLFPDRPLVARLGAALLAISPFLAFHAAAYMSHVLALALIALAALAALRAAEGSPVWSALAGGAIGVAFAARPLTAVVLGLVAVVLTWTLHPLRDAHGRAAWVRHLALAGAGAAPAVLATLLYNRRLFGAATRFGYAAGEGPGHDLGFHVDPWGDPYGLRQALGYTGADLQGLSLDLLQSAIPLAVVVAVFLLAAPRLSRGAALASAWALLPVAAQLFYWHHDLFMGPRLLYESAPGWIWLFAAAVVAAIEGAPEPPRSRWGPRRAGVTTALALGVVLALAFTGPAKLTGYRAVAERSGMAVEAPPVTRPTLVFVHGGWEDRLGARLAAAGMRVDSIRRALRSNSSCAIELHLGAREGRRGAEGSALTPALAFEPAAGPPPRALTMPSGSVIRSFEGEALHPICEREAASDFEGAIGLPPLVWQGDLPGLPGRGAMFVRDLGPERNARLIARFPDRQPRVLLSRRGSVQLVPYDEGMRELWVGSPL